MARYYPKPSNCTGTFSQSIYTVVFLANKNRGGSTDSHRKNLIFWCNYSTDFPLLPRGSWNSPSCGACIPIRTDSFQGGTLVENVGISMFCIALEACSHFLCRYWACGRTQPHQLTRCAGTIAGIILLARSPARWHFIRLFIEQNQLLDVLLPG